MADVGGGQGRDLMGHPLKALAWLANEANARGEQLRAGDVCILGSLVSSKFPQQGDLLRFQISQTMLLDSLLNGQQSSEVKVDGLNW